MPDERIVQPFDAAFMFCTALHHLKSFLVFLGENIEAKLGKDLRAGRSVSKSHSFEDCFGPPDARMQS